MSATEKTYRVNEIFYSLQGEGFHTGRPAVFVRMSGCNRRCTFCDTDHSRWEAMTADQIVAEASRYGARFMVVTGGEPLLQLDTLLIDRIHEAGFEIAVETNGSIDAPEGIDWVTCSPKEGPLQLKKCDELKVIFTSSEAPYAAAEAIEAKHRFVQPLCNPADGSTNVDEVVDWLLGHPDWRLSLQTHKLLDIR